LPTSEEAHNLISRLRSDHDFFMKELAAMIEILREMAGAGIALPDEVEDLKQRLRTITKRLEAHNRLEEERAYAWPAMLFEESRIAELREKVRRELDNLPPRFA
jgi:hypothetical protein